MLVAIVTLNLLDVLERHCHARYSLLAACFINWCDFILVSHCRDVISVCLVRLQKHCHFVQMLLGNITNTHNHNMIKNMTTPKYFFCNSILLVVYFVNDPSHRLNNTINNTIKSMIQAVLIPDVFTYIS